MKRDVELWGGPCDGTIVEILSDVRYVDVPWFHPTDGLVQARYERDPIRSDLYRYNGVRRPDLGGAA